MAELIETWSSEAFEEDSMTDEHLWIWREMIASVPADLRAAKVLDVGCNQGGFLRELYDTKPFAEGIGIDLAEKAVALAEQRKANRPLRYVAATDLSEAGGGFDIAFSHEVIYLIEDLSEHARQIAQALKPGATYNAVTCCHSDNPLWSRWRPMIKEFSNLDVPDHSVGEIAAAFRSAGLLVSIARFLAASPIPVEGPSRYFPSDVDRIEVYGRWKLMFTARRPTT
ncbi:MAG: class I SAM-dependent methyltransferase [Pseudomonadota bacterium]